MNGFDYLIIDQVVYTFKNGRTVRIDRSKMPRCISSPVPDGMTLKQYIEETEELMVHVLFEDGTWNVSVWEGEMYKEEIENLGLGQGLKFNDMRRVTREVVYRLL
jgi:hypothetical protein